MSGVREPPFGNVAPVPVRDGTLPNFRGRCAAAWKKDPLSGVIGA